DHQPAIAHRVTGVVVPAAAHRYLEAVVAREADCCGHVLCGRAADDHRRPAVDGAVPHRASGVIRRILVGQDGAAELGAERVEAGAGNLSHGETPCADLGNRRSVERGQPALAMMPATSSAVKARIVVVRTLPIEPSLSIAAVAVSSSGASMMPTMS